MSSPVVERFGPALLGVVSVLLTSAGLTGVGDAPDPHDLPTEMAAHFVNVGDAVMRAAPLGYLGALGIGGFLLLLARRLQGDDPSVHGSILKVGGLVIAGYLVGLHVVYTALAYQVAEFSPQATQALFVPTILAVPAIGATTAALLLTAAAAARRHGVMPRWWLFVTVLGALTASLAVVSFQDGGFLSPDVQQQAVFNTVLVWVLLTSVALTSRVSRRAHTPVTRRPAAPTTTKAGHAT